MIIKVRDYIMLIKYLDQKGHDSVERIIIRPKYPSCDVLIGIGITFNRHEMYPDVPKGYEYLMDFYVINDRWGLGGFSEPFSEIYLDVHPQRQDAYLRFPDEFFRDAVKNSRRIVMTIDDIVRALTEGKNLSLKDKCKLRKKVIVELQKICGVSAPAIWRWDAQDHIPDDRVSQIKQHYQM